MKMFQKTPPSSSQMKTNGSYRYIVLSLKLVVFFLLGVKRPPSFGKKNGGMLTYFSRYRLHNFGKRDCLKSYLAQVLES